MSDHRLTTELAGNHGATRIEGAAAMAAFTAERATRSTAVAITATVGLAAGCWAFAVWRMSGMDMGVATELGSFASFAVLWLAMMAAMMLPGTIPAVVRRVQADRGGVAVASFVGSYLVVWAAVGVAVYAVYRPHGSAAAAAVVLAAGIYELTPLKRYFRRRCNEFDRSGLEFGCCCVGSSFGLMLMLVALGVMNVVWMSVIAVVVVGQKLVPAKAAVDVPIALAIVGLGIFIAIAPGSLPGLVPPT
jgi:predicted metal-binding membrane protein